jgi:secreted trypsin-like serine protease
MGDSGGPLTVNGRVAGAVSWGVPCGTAAPDMFARISAVYDWMRANFHASNNGNGQ